MATLLDKYNTYLFYNPTYKKLPYIVAVNSLDTYISTGSILEANPSLTSLRRINLIKNSRGKEVKMQIYQKGCDLKKYGRLSGNMVYVEDLWSVQIQPVTIKYVYRKDGSAILTESREMKVRDKYLKIRIRYSGDDLAIITAIKTLYTLSYS